MHNSNAVKNNSSEPTPSAANDSIVSNEEVIQDDTTASLEALFQATEECEEMQYTRELLDLIDVEINKALYDD